MRVFQSKNCIESGFLVLENYINSVSKLYGEHILANNSEFFGNSLNLHYPFAA